MSAEDVLIRWGSWARTDYPGNWPSATPVWRLMRYGAGAGQSGGRPSEPPEDVLLGERLVLSIGREHCDGAELQLVLVTHYSQPGAAYAKARRCGLSLRTYYRRLNQALAWCDRELEGVGTENVLHSQD